MMQDCTRIRSLEGSRTLLTWDNEVHGDAAGHANATEQGTTAKQSNTETDLNKATVSSNEAATSKETVTSEEIATVSHETSSALSKTVKGITIAPDTKLFDLFNKVDGLRHHMPQINSNFAMLNTTFGKIMAKNATIAKAAGRSGMSESELIDAISEFIEKQ